MKRIMAGIFLLGASLIAADLEPHVTAELAHRTAYLGDPVDLVVRVQFDDQWQFGANPLPEKLGEATVLDQEWFQPEREEGSNLNRWELRARVAWYRLGEKKLPPIELLGTRADGAVESFATPELTLEIVKMLDEEDERIAPEKGQVSLKAMPLWPIILGGVLLLVLVGALVLFFLSKRKREPEAKVVPLLAPDVEALDRLHKLTHGSLLKEGRVKEFYVAINLIIRHYYGRLWNIHAEEMTSFEMEAWLEEKRGLPTEFQRVNRDFQELCDRVKFAKHDPMESENKEAVNWAYQIVSLLKPPKQEDGHVAAG